MHIDCTPKSWANITQLMSIRYLVPINPIYFGMSKGNIFITGVSSGIGRATAIKFLDEGYRVFGTIRNLEDAKELVHRYNMDFVAIQLEVTDPISIANAARQVRTHLDGAGLDLLMNNSGIAISAPTTRITLDQYRRQFEVNFFGIIGVTKAFIPLLRIGRHGKKPGRIFNISSVSGHLFYPLMGPYCSSKSALEAFSHTLRRELMIYGVDVVIIAPGPIKTSIWKKSTEISEDIRNSEYGAIASRLVRIVRKKSEKAMSAEKCASRIYQIFCRRHPAARYTITQSPFTNWVIPRYFISHRMLDKLIGKSLKMLS